jgi:PAS domain-containing protein
LDSGEQDLVGRPWQHPAGAAEPASSWQAWIADALAEDRMSVTPAPAGLGLGVLIQVCPAAPLVDASGATLLKEVVSNLPVVLFASDLDGICTASEGELLAGLGLAPGQIVGLSLYEVYRAHPDIGDSLRRAMAGESFATMAQVGGIAFETYYRPLHDAERAIVGAVGVAIDVTQRVQAEEALRRSETITTSLLDAMPCTLYRIDGAELVLTVRPESPAVDEADGPALTGRCATSSPPRPRRSWTAACTGPWRPRRRRTSSSRWRTSVADATSTRRSSPAATTRRCSWSGTSPSDASWRWSCGTPRSWRPSAGSPRDWPTRSTPPCSSCGTT